LKRRRRGQATGVLLRGVRLYDVHEVPSLFPAIGTVELTDTARHARRDIRVGQFPFVPDYPVRQAT
jgi:hypothetical protein